MTVGGVIVQTQLRESGNRNDEINEAIMHNTGTQTERLCQPWYIRYLVAIFEYVLPYREYWSIFAKNSISEKSFY